MTLLNYYKKLKAGQKKQLADELGTSLAYLRHLAYSRRKASPKMAQRIELATQRQVSRRDLRPDIYE